jgi:hypothetical protein
MRVTGWTLDVLRAQPASVIRAHFHRIFVGLVWSPELADAARTPIHRENFGNPADYHKALVAKGEATAAFDRVTTALWPED